MYCAGQVHSSIRKFVCADVCYFKWIQSLPILPFSTVMIWLRLPRRFVDLICRTLSRMWINPSFLFIGVFCSSLEWAKSLSWDFVSCTLRTCVCKWKSSFVPVHYFSVGCARTRERQRQIASDIALVSVFRLSVCNMRSHFARYRL